MIRTFLVKALYQKLLGPEYGIHEEAEHPYAKYQAGILSSSFTEQQGNPDHEDHIDGNLRTDAADRSESIEEGTDNDFAGGENNFTVPDTDLDPRSGPRSIGISFVIMGKSPKIRVCLTWARYRPHPGLAVQEGVFQRIPNFFVTGWLDATQPLNGMELEDGIDGSSVSDPGVRLHVIPRPVPGTTDRWTVNVFLENRTQYDTAQRQTELQRIFQPQIRILKDKGSDIEHFDPSDAARTDKDYADDLAYYSRRTKARGYLCAAVWDEVDPGNESEEMSSLCWPDAGALPSEIAEEFASPSVRTEFIPLYTILQPELTDSMKFDADVLANEWDADKIRKRLELIVSRYKEWISSQRTNLESNFSNEVDLRRIGEENLKLCEESCDRIDGGIKFICEDERARAAFCLMNAVMSDNYRNNKGDWGKDEEGKRVFQRGSPLQWREFQMAFILQCIRGVAGNEIKERDLCDVLWFPTGGGKTEAYLGITVFAIAYRRLANTKLKNDGGVTVISRYTLRLLTIQQFQRALGVIVSADLRRVGNWMPEKIADGTLELKDPDLAKRFLAKRIWGSQRFSIGLWIGGSITPNDWAYKSASLGKIILNAEGTLLPAGHDARRRTTGDQGDPAQVQNCPVCGNTLCLPSEKKSRIQETKRLTWIVRSSISINDLQAIPRANFESTMYNVSLEGDPTFTKISDAPENMTYYRLTMTIRSGLLTRDNVDHWWNYIKDLLDPAGDSEPLESTRASMPGYFFVKMQGRARPHDFAIYCTDGECPLNQREWYEETENNCVVPIPRPFENGNNRSRFVPISAFTIDEQVYARCPSFVLATSDKFAQLPFEPRCASLFGNVDTVHRNFGYGRRNCYKAPLLQTRGRRHLRIEVEADELNQAERFSPPSLIIQDELHLIEGPLGSMVGIYEMAVDVLATEGEQRPKYIASSATIKEADSQVGTIFRREIRTFPQPGIDASDNHFAKVGEDASCLEKKPGRLYMGLCPAKSVYEMPIKAQAIVMSEIYKIRQNPLGYGLTAQDAVEETDPYWTYVSYFSDLQLLSRFHSFYLDDILRDVKTLSPTRIANSANRLASFPLEPGTRVFPITANMDIEIFNVSVFCNNRIGRVSVALYEDGSPVGRKIYQYTPKRCSNGENEFVSTEAVATLRSGEKIWVAVTNTDEHTSFQSVQTNEPWLEDTQNLGNPPEEFPDLFQGLTDKTDPAVRIQLLSSARPLDENKCIQLSSATPSSELPQHLEDMARKNSDVDCVLTSPVFGTGIDVDRLALMKIMNQPKTNSGYIQSSGRVGRTEPGLVMNWLRSGRARDLSHYENFVGYHRTIHKHVEPVTASPFSQESMRLCLGPIIVAILRNANNVSGTPVAHEWVTDLHGPQRMGTHGGDQEVVAVRGALARIADERCIAEFRRMPHDEFVELFDQMQTVWHQLAQDLANNTEREFSYEERIPLRTPEKNVVLGTPNHTDLQFDVAYENTPNSLRQTEPTASFSTANERDLAVQIRPSQFITRYGPGSLLPGKSVTLIAPPLGWMVSNLERIQKFMEHNNANQTGLGKYEIADLQMRRILSRFNRDVDPDQLKMFGLPTNSSVGKGDYESVYNCEIFPEWGMCYGHTGPIILAKIETIAGRGRVIRCPECQDQNTDFYSKRFTSVRMLSACSRGHMSDLPWHNLVHQQNIACLGDVFEWQEAGSGDDINFVCRGHWDPRDERTFIESSCGPQATNYRALKAMSIRGQLECQGIFAESGTVDPHGCPPDENGNSLAKITYKSQMSLRMPVVKTTLNIEPYMGRLYESLSQPLVAGGMRVWVDSQGGSWTKDDFVERFLERQAQFLRIGSPTIRLVRNAEEADLRRAVTEVMASQAGGNAGDREITEIQALQEELESLENYTRDRGAGVGIGNTGGTVTDIRFPISFDTPFGLDMEAMPFSTIKVTQVQTSYTREIHPVVDPNQPGGQEENVGRVGKHVSIPLRHTDQQDYRWYCGNQLLGEGIFLHLDPSKHTDQTDIFNSSHSEDLEKWRSIHENFLGRVREARHSYDETPEDERQDDLQRLDAMELEALSLNPIFVWWHSFAHEFINQLSVDSGFMTVSLGERVYCVRREDGSYSAGLFIYACSPGSDGTLGGLTSLVDGDILPRIVERTAERIRTCSNDPVCSARRINSSRKNGAACHVCLMNPETSCSYRNRFLDRNVVRETM